MASISGLFSNPNLQKPNNFASVSVNPAQYSTVFAIRPAVDGKIGDVVGQ
ncbi:MULTISPECIES: hypothetical protein [Methylomonas]|nr:hypothetical protein [Methylomonas koyamae]